MVLERGLVETDDSATENILHLMASHKVIPPVDVHNWEKMLVHPKPGESLLSWLMRQSWKFGIKPKRLIQSEKEYWLLKENISLSLPREQYWPVILDVLPASSAWENVLRQRGLNGINELQLDISEWFDLNKAKEAKKHKLENYYSYSLRYCPLCWRDENSRYFRILWRLPFVVFCLEHGVELRELCSSCGGLLFDDKKHRRSSTILLQNFSEKWILSCRHCNHSLTDEDVEIKPELARLQKHILETLLSESNWATPSGYLIFWNTYLIAVETQEPDSAETCLKFMDAILRKPPMMPNSNCYSQELIAEFERRLQIVTLYLSGTSARNLTKKSGMAERSIKTFAKDLLDGRLVDEIIKRQFGSKGKFGLEIAQAELRAFKARHGRLPRVEDNIWRAIITAIQRGKWASFGISRWNDLLRKTFGEVNKENGIYIGEQGLEHAIYKLRAFKLEIGRLPRSTDKERSGIEDAISRGEWVSFGIKRWNDLLRRTFGEVNVEHRVYTGDQTASGVQAGRRPKPTGIDKATQKMAWDDSKEC